jgi:long-chain acyl-CoA synthetase
MITTIGECLGWLKGSIVNFVVRKIKKMVPAYDLPTAIPYAKVMAEGKKFKLKYHKG